MVLQPSIMRRTSCSVACATFGTSLHSFATSIEPTHPRRPKSCHTFGTSLHCFATRLGNQSRGNRIVVPHSAQVCMVLQPSPLFIPPSFTDVPHSAQVCMVLQRSRLVSNLPR